jgi:hypothetical protein
MCGSANLKGSTDWVWTVELLCQIGFAVQEVKVPNLEAAMSTVSLKDDLSWWWRCRRRQREGHGTSCSKSHPQAFPCGSVDSIAALSSLGRTRCMLFLVFAILQNKPALAPHLVLKPGNSTFVGIVVCLAACASTRPLYLNTHVGYRRGERVPPVSIAMPKERDVHDALTVAARLPMLECGMVERPKDGYGV